MIGLLCYIYLENERGLPSGRTPILIISALVASWQILIANFFMSVGWACSWGSFTGLAFLKERNRWELP